jgi:hypothetical protein
MKHDQGHTLKIIMPDGSDNYLHLQLYNDVDSMLLIRDLLLEQEIYSNDIHINEDGTYYRIWLKLKDANDDEYVFHSRKLNLNDVVFERMQLIK